MHLSSQKNTGVISITALVFMGIFVAVLTGLLSSVALQKKVQLAKEQGLSSLEIAEGGLDYYKWFLAHFPKDIQDGTGAPGPYVHDYIDPEGGASIGKFSLDITGNFQCGELSRVDIVSTGWTNENPNITKVVQGGYARPSVAKYSYLLDSAVWAGEDRQINGPYHSNGGIHFSGTNFSSVTSNKTTWNCSGYGCSPASSSANGVIKDAAESNPNTALWKWPVANIDFNIISQDLGTIFNKNVASSTPSACVAGQALGCYFPRTTGGARGYQVVLKNDGSFDLYRVNTAENIWGCAGPGNCSTCSSSGWQQVYSVIANTGSGGNCPYAPTAAARTFLGNYTPPTACKLLYIDDYVWLEGNVNGKITVIAASSTSAFDPNIYLRNNIVYTTGGGADGLTALAENNIFIPVDSPNNFTLNGIFIAQKGYLGRDYFLSSGCSGKNVASKYSACVVQNQIDILGTTVSKLRTGTKWGNTASGYTTRIDNYDSSLTASPPPFTPFTSNQYEFVTWSQNQ
jgi:hypothetical protein